MTNNSLSRFELKDRVIVITGGAGLLGVMHAESIAGAGGTPVLADLNGNSAEKSAASIAEKFGVPTLGIKTDITGKASVEKLRDAILNRFGRIDGLINNAANNPKMEDTQQTTEWSRFENFSLDAWEQDMSVGLKGAFLCSQVFRRLRPGKLRCVRCQWE